MSDNPASIRAIEFTRAVFEYVHGNIGLLKFNIEELKPVDPAEGEANKWEIICSFYETLGSTSPSRYRVLVNLVDKAVDIKKLSGEPSEPEKKFNITEESPEKE